MCVVHVAFLFGLPLALPRYSMTHFSKVALFFSLAALGLVSACSGEDDLRPMGLDSKGAGLGSNVLEGPCEQSQEQACGITLEQGNGVISCYRGRQYGRVI